ncbi:MAG: hypothetical protein JO278_01085 [Dyella sp.]|nr:hypothetical protein [Dyella sp.]
MQWPSDLIGYDALSSYGSPSYWVQVMFAERTGTEVVASTLTNAGPRIAESVTRDEERRKIFIKVVNGTSNPQRFQIALDGTPNVKRQATLVTMSGKSPNATNTIDHPENIKPVERMVQVAGPKFEYSFVPYSVNVMELSY